MQTKLIEPFLIETDVSGEYDFFQPYLEQTEWTDINTLYAKHSEYQDTMHDKKPVYHYIKHIENYDIKLKKFVMKLFKDFGVKSKDFRADFFLTKPGGFLPMHVDGMSKIAFLLPLTTNTGPLVCEDDNNRHELTYQTLTVLNTQKSHGVLSPTEDRLLFRIAVHDVMFEDLGIYKSLTETV